MLFLWHAADSTQVVITDYPDRPLIDNIKSNITQNNQIFSEGSQVEATVHSLLSIPFSPPSPSPLLSPSPSFDLYSLHLLFLL